MNAVTPGRASYERRRRLTAERLGEALEDFGVSWDEQSDANRAVEEAAAQDAIAAYIELNGRDPVDIRSVVAEALAAGAVPVGRLETLAAHWDGEATRIESLAPGGKHPRATAFRDCAAGLRTIIVQAAGLAGTTGTR